MVAKSQFRSTLSPTEAPCDQRIDHCYGIPSTGQCGRPVEMEYPSGLDQNEQLLWIGNVRFDFCQQLTQSGGADRQIALPQESILFVTERDAR